MKYASGFITGIVTENMNREVLYCVNLRVALDVTSGTIMIRSAQLHQLSEDFSGEPRKKDLIPMLMPTEQLEFVGEIK